MNKKQEMATILMIADEKWKKLTPIEKGAILYYSKSSGLGPLAFISLVLMPEPKAKERTMKEEL